jgi:hypothetical protein
LAQDPHAAASDRQQGAADHELGGQRQTSQGEPSAWRRVAVDPVAGRRLGRVGNAVIDGPWLLRMFRATGMAVRAAVVSVSGMGRITRLAAVRRGGSALGCLRTWVRLRRPGCCAVGVRECLTVISDVRMAVVAQ